MSCLNDIIVRESHHHGLIRPVHSAQVVVAGLFLMSTGYQAPLYTSDMIIIDLGDKHGFLLNDGSHSHILSTGL